MRMTFLAKLSAAVFKVVVDSFGVPSSSLALVYVNWLSGAELSPGWGSFSSLPVVGVPPGWGSFSSFPVVSPSEPEELTSEPEVPPEPVVSLVWGAFPSPPVVVPVWFFSVESVSFSSLPVEDVLPLVSTR